MSDEEFQERVVLENEILGALKAEASPVKARALLERVLANERFFPHQVTRSIWRLVDKGQIDVQPGRGITLLAD